jgi:DNA sulfur modification protein DndE|tara:strand:+ start:926 stop:1315 length:390 start_codon:yes stop_codon:yes gene_type:complete
MIEALKIESLKLSDRSSNEISTIKRNTKIETMNIICRWALTVSLSSDLPPPPLAKEDKILREIDWKIFAGDYEHLIMALLKDRLFQEKIEITNDSLNDQLRAHVQRGLSLIASQKKIRSIADFAELGLS